MLLPVVACRGSEQLWADTPTPHTPPAGGPPLPARVRAPLGLDPLSRQHHQLHGLELELEVFLLCGHPSLRPRRWEQTRLPSTSILPKF